MYENVESMKDGNIVERVVYWAHIWAIMTGIAACFLAVPTLIIYELLF